MGLFEFGGGEGCFLECHGFVSFFPGDVCILLTEVTIVGRLPIDRTAELQLADDLGGFESEGLSDRHLNGLFRNRGCTEGVDVDGDRIGMSDGVGELHFAAFGKPGCDDILGDIPAHIGGGTIDLGRILSGESSTPMPPHSSISIDDDLATGEAGVTLRSADNETACRIDQKLGLLREHLGWDDLANDFLNAEFLDLLVTYSLSVLGGDHDIDNADRLAIDIFDGDLALRVGTEPLGGTALAESGQFAAEAVGIHDRGRHQLRCLVAGVTEHQSLIARTLLGGLLAIGFLGIHPLGDIGTLRSDDVVNEDAIGVEDIVIVVITDLPDCIAYDLSNVDC